MPKNGNFSQTIRYKGQLDVSNIITALQRVRSELMNSSALKNKEGVFVNVDKEMKNIENLSTQLKAALQKGFSNTKDVRNFEKITESLDVAINKVASDLQGISASKLTQELKAAKEELVKQKQNLNDVIAAERTFINLQMQGVKHGKDYTNLLIQGLKSGKELKKVQEEISNELSNQLKRQEELRNSAQRNVDTAKERLRAEKVSAVNKIIPTFREGSFKRIVEPERQVDVSGKQYGKISEVIAKVIPTAKNADDAVKKFTQELEKMKIVASQDATKKLRENFDDYKNSIKAAEGNLKQAENELKSTENQIGKLNDKIKVQQQLINESTKNNASERELKTIQNRINKLNAELAVRKRLRNEQAATVESLKQSLDTAKGNLGLSQSDFKRTVSSKTVSINTAEYERIKQIFRETIINANSADDAVRRFKEELTKMNITPTQAAINNVSSGFQQLQTNTQGAEAALRTAENELRNIISNLERANQQPNANNILNSEQVQASIQRIVTSLRQVEQAQNNVNTASNSMGRQVPRLEEINRGLQQYRANARNAAQSVNELAGQQQKLDGTFDHFLRYIQYTFSLVNGIRVLRRVIQSTFNDVKLLDAAFASIAMVTDYSVKEMWESYDDYAEMANRLGQSTEDVIKSSALFYQQYDAFYIEKI